MEIMRNWYIFDGIEETRMVHTGCLCVGVFISFRIKIYRKHGNKHPVSEWVKIPQETESPNNKSASPRIPNHLTYSLMRVRICCRCSPCPVLRPVFPLLFPRLYRQNLRVNIVTVLVIVRHLFLTNVCLLASHD